MSSTRAIQIGFLLSGLIDPTTGDPLTGGKVYFYEAGTTTPKNVWTEKEKTNPYTSVTLDAGGIKQIYGDGTYKILVYDSDDVLVYTWDNIRLRHSSQNILQKIATYTTTNDDDIILFDTAAGDITVNLHAAADWEQEISISNIGANNVIIDPSGAETIDGAATKTLYTTEYIVLYSDGSNIHTAPGQSNSMTFLNEGLHILDTDGSHDLVLKAGSNLTSDRILSLVTGDAARTITLSGNPTLADWFDQSVKTTSSPTFLGISFIPPGTKMLFYQDTAPTGWTIQNTLDDKVVFVTKGSAAGGQTGGGVHSTGTWTQPYHTHTYTTVITHTHSYSTKPFTGSYGAGTGAGVTSTGSTARTTGSTGSSSGTTANGATANTWRPAAYCCIICAKD